MDIEKTGKFIKELRTEQGLSQYKLAELLFVSRESISKWERGLVYPNNSSLLEMSKLFNVSTNELLFGERENKDNKDKITKLALTLYEDRNKKNKMLKITVLIIIMLLLSFLAYYFISTYNSLKVYNIGYIDNDITISNGVLVYTKEKIYFNLGNIDTTHNIDKLKLYYKYKGKEKHITTITGSNYLTMVEFNSKDSVFDFKNIENVLENLFLEITISDVAKEIKLDYAKSFSNDYILPSIEESGTTSPKIEYDKEIEDKIKQKFKKVSDVYVYEKKNYTFTYIEEAKLLNLLIIENNISKEWNYDITTRYLEFSEYNDKKTFNYFSYNNNEVTCNINTCKNEEQEIETFDNLFKDILNN